MVLVFSVFANPISLWAAVQLLMEIYNFPLNRRIKLLEEKKLKLENEQLEQKKDCNSVVREKIKAKLAEHQATALFESLKKRLEHNPIKLKDIELLG